MVLPGLFWYNLWQPKDSSSHISSYTPKGLVMQLGLLDITYKFKILELTFNMDSTQASTAHLFKDDNQRERERERVKT